MRKYLAILLILALMLGLCACGGKEPKKDEQKEGKQPDATASVDLTDLYEWQEISGGIEITKYLGKETKVVVPSVLDNKAVVSVGTAFSGNATLEDLELPETVNKADLSNCKALKRLVAHGITYVTTHSMTKIYLTGCTALEYIEFSKATDVYFDQSLPSVRELILPSLAHVNGSRFPKTVEKLDISGATKILPVQLPNLKEVTIGKGMQWYIYDVDDEGIETTIESVCAEKPNDYFDGERVYSREITEENKARVYCELFKCNEIIVNGVKYTYSE